MPDYDESTPLEHTQQGPQPTEPGGTQPPAQEDPSAETPSSEETGATAADSDRTALQSFIEQSLLSIRTALENKD